ncbi:hypothetical protein KBD81_00165 [Candidatus Woesebacteria bacterium]|nr:hypothetical protein [Candidatus Woesebacteria bacterium]
MGIIQIYLHMVYYNRILKYLAVFFLLFSVVSFAPLQVAAVPTDAEAAASCVKPRDAAGAEIEFNQPSAKNSFPACATVEVSELGFQIPSLGDILTFAIRAFFVIAGLAALFYLLLGAMAWVTSGGDKDAITAAREKIQAAVLGMIMIVAVLAVIWTLEQVIFKRRICLGLSCPLTLPGLIERTQNGDFCCVCIKRSDNSLGQIVNTANYKCNDDGTAAPL